MPAKIPSRLLALATAMAVLGAALLLAAHPVSAQTPSNNANLSALSILGTAVPGFNADTTSYTISLDAPERPATIAATAADANATVEYNPADADTETGGHQVVLNEGDNTVTVTVTAEDTTTTKSYTVTVTALDAADSAATTAQAPVDDRTSASAVHYLGSIGEAGDVDWIRVELESDQMYRFALKGSYRNSGWTLDVPVIIGLYNDEGGYINGTHAVGSVGHQLTTNARLHYMAEADGDYYVGVRGIEDQTGTYGLRVLEVPDDVQPDNASTPGAIAVDGSQQGVIDYRGDVDWYQVSALESRKEYVVELSARAGWPLRLPTVLVYDSAGDLVRVDYLESLRSRAVFTPAYGGTYYIAALSRFNSTGRYTLELARVPAVAVTVSFGAAAYSAAEGGAVEVIVTLSEDPKRPVTIPISKANRGGASDADYSGVPASVTFESTDTERTFTFRATDDTVDDDGESVTLSFGTLPDWVTEGAPATATVSITDNDVPDVTVSFGAAAYSATEGGTVTVKVTLTADPERPVTIPIDKTEQGGAGSADYSGVPASVAFESGETERSFTVTATDDTVADDGESVTLSFGTLPTGVSAGTPATATVSITDDDVPADWSLIPPGLGPGDKFRLLFVTSGRRNSRSTDIADYNAFVQEDAGGGHRDIQSRSSSFRALGSTGAVDARDNTATAHTADDRGVPIHWLNGPKAADDYADFYDGSWDHRNPIRDDGGGSVTFGDSDYIWTGSGSDGTEYIDLGGTHWALGSAVPRTGVPGAGVGYEISSIRRGSDVNAPFYGLSGVFRVEGVAAVDNADLSDLRVDGTSVAGFAASTTSYTVGVADTVDQVTIAASTADPGATLAYGVDADPSAAGHQVDFPLSDDQAAATVTVTAQDSTTKTYTVNLVRPVPGPPTIASVTPGDGTLTVAWSAPTETGGANIIAYGVRYILTDATDKADANWTVVEDAWASGTLEYVIATGLTHDMGYDVQVRAVNSRGDGEWSATGTGTPAVSTDATLRSLSVSPVDIHGFDADRTTYYHVGVASTVAQVTVTAVPANSNAAVAYADADDNALDDADPNVGGHQVDLSPGLNTVSVTVTAEDGVSSETYTVHVGLGVTDAYGWKAVDDFNYLERAENAAPYGLWSDGETMWVVDALVNRLYAYNLETRARVPDQDFTTLTDSGNNHAGEIWSDGEIMWVVDWNDRQLYAYDRDTKARVPGRDFTSLDAGNVYPIAIWSDGETIWIADNGPQAKIFAYDLETKERIAGQDFTRLDQSTRPPVAIWSDGATMWVAAT